MAQDSARRDGPRVRRGLVAYACRAGVSGQTAGPTTDPGPIDRSTSICGTPGRPSRPRLLQAWTQAGKRSARHPRPGDRRSFDLALVVLAGIAAEHRHAAARGTRSRSGRSKPRRGTSGDGFAHGEPPAPQARGVGQGAIAHNVRPFHPHARRPSPQRPSRSPRSIRRRWPRRR